jgi:hypothetical protein
LTFQICDEITKVQPAFVTIGLVRLVLMNPSESKRLKVVRPRGSRLNNIMSAASKVRAKGVTDLEQPPTVRSIRPSIEWVSCFKIDLDIFRQDLSSMITLIALTN